MTTTTTKSLLSFQIHPNPSPKLISLLVIAGIYFLACQSYRFPGRRRVFWKSSPGLDVRSLVAKSGQGKHSILFWKVKEIFWSKALFSVYFCPFSSKSTIGDKIVETLYSTRVTFGSKRIHTPSPSPLFKVGEFVVFYK